MKNLSTVNRQFKIVLLVSERSWYVMKLLERISKDRNNVVLLLLKQHNVNLGISSINNNLRAMGLLWTSKKLLLRHEFAFTDEGKAINWFKFLKFPSFAEAETVQVKFKSQTPLSTTIFDTTGIERARYQAEKICQSGQPFRQVKKGDKI